MQHNEHGEHDPGEHVRDTRYRRTSASGGSQDAHEKRDTRVAEAERALQEAGMSAETGPVEPSPGDGPESGRAPVPGDASGGTRGRDDGLRGRDGRRRGRVAGLPARR